MYEKYVFGYLQVEVLLLKHPIEGPFGSPELVLDERLASYSLHEHGAIGGRNQELPFANLDSVCCRLDL